MTGLDFHVQPNETVRFRNADQDDWDVVTMAHLRRMESIAATYGQAKALHGNVADSSSVRKMMDALREWIRENRKAVAS